MTDFPRLHAAVAALEATQQPDADAIRKGIRSGLEHTTPEPNRTNAPNGRRPRTDPVRAKGRKDNAPPAILRRGQNR